MKKTAIALAVAAIAAAPLTAQAVETYASVRIGLERFDGGSTIEEDGSTTDHEASTTIRGFASRLGFKGETDLGNGMTGFGKYEFGVGTEGSGTNVTRRHALVGLKGDFGSLTLGQTYHTWYNMVVGQSDMPWWGNNQGFVGLAYTGRTAQAATYKGDFGGVGVGATVYMDNSTPGGAATDAEDVDGIEAAVSFMAGPAYIGIGMQDLETNADAATGIAVNVPVGPVDLRGNLVTQGDDTSVHVYAGFGNAYLDYGQNDIDATGNTPFGFTLGYTHSIGPQTTAWFEFQSVDDDDGSDAATVVRAVLKYDM